MYIKIISRSYAKKVGRAQREIMMVRIYILIFEMKISATAPLWWPFQSGRYGISNPFINLKDQSIHSLNLSRLDLIFIDTEASPEKFSVNLREKPLW